jgi:thiol-disulfide isomerase/thioredoxin
LTDQLRQSLANILDPDQRVRLDQLRRQALGTRMVIDPEVADALSIDDQTRTELVAAFAETDRKVAEIQSQVQTGKRSTPEAQRELEALKDAEKRTLVSALSEDQRAAIGSLVGPAFDFSAVKRTYPLAPELETEGVVWIQGSPVTMQDLRGKVVAVHFYAFQCHNCIANLPHYDAWHQDYADEGLVVIGIQTPETSRERQPESVAADAKRKGIAYPVLLDAQRSNWDAWGNRVWPTVYLVDRQGFIRRWWRGEMNWKGTKGEPSMRRTIESLLAEQP